MNKLFNIIFKDLKKDKSIYYSLIISLIISLVFGIMFITILKDSDKALLSNHIDSYFDNIKTGNYKMDLSLLLSNNLIAMLISILGFCIIGIPILIIILFYKGFTLSFTITSLIYNFKIDGIFFSFIYIFPHLIINLIFYFILIYYSFKLSISMIDTIINKKAFNKLFLKKYIVILLISLFFISISSLYETFILPHLIKMIY